MTNISTFTEKHQKKCKYTLFFYNIILFLLSILVIGCLALTVYNHSANTMNTLSGCLLTLLFIFITRWNFMYKKLARYVFDVDYNRNDLLALQKIFKPNIIDKIFMIAIIVFLVIYMFIWHFIDIHIAAAILYLISQTALTVMAFMSIASAASVYNTMMNNLRSMEH